MKKNNNSHVFIIASVFLLSSFYSVFEAHTASAQSDIPGNKVETAPLADAGPDQTSISGSIVTLNGSGSFDPDGDNITDYKWLKYSGEPDIALPGVPYGDIYSHLQSPSFGAPIVETPQNVTFELVVTDNKTNSAPDYTTIQIFPIGQNQQSSFSSESPQQQQPTTSLHSLSKPSNFETDSATNTTANTPQNGGGGVATTSTNGPALVETLMMSISSLLSSSNLTEPSIANSIISKINSTANNTGIVSLASSLLGSLLSSASHDKGTGVADTVAPATVQANDITTTPSPSSSSTMIHPENFTAQSGNVSDFDQNPVSNVSESVVGSIFADRSSSPEASGEQKGIVQKDVTDSIRRAISMGIEIPEIQGYDNNKDNATVYVKVNVSDIGEKKANASDFLINVSYNETDGGYPGIISFTAPDAGVIMKLPESTYNITAVESETGDEAKDSLLNSYASSYSDGCHGQVGKGETKDCIITKKSAILPSSNVTIIQ